MLNSIKDGTEVFVKSIYLERAKVFFVTIYCVYDEHPIAG